MSGAPTGDSQSPTGTYDVSMADRPSSPSETSNDVIDRAWSIIRDISTDAILTPRSMRLASRHSFKTAV